MTKGFCNTIRLKQSLIVAIAPLSLGQASAVAQNIIFDGNFSTTDLGNGPVYNIQATDGRLSLDNQSIFYSFERFSLAGTETANFEAGGALNIISRVTGAAPSILNGTLNAPTNFYFINPNGVTIQNGAAINVNGLFEASTRDTLAFDSGRFSVTHPDQFTGVSLTITGDPGGFTGAASRDIRVDSVTLDFPDLQGITLDAANVEVQSSRLELSTDDATPAGQIFFSADGTVRTDSSILSTNANLGSTGDAGLILMSAESIQLERTQLQAGTFGTGRAGVIWLLTPDSGEVIFEDQSIAFSTIENGGNSLNSGLNNVTETPFHILVSTGNLQLSGDSQLQTLIRSGGAGSAGWIGVIAQNVTMEDAAIFSDIQSGATSGSVAGAVGFIVDNLLLNDSLITTSLLEDGQAGVIFVEAANEVLLNEGFILSGVDTGVTATINPDFTGAIQVTANRVGLDNASAITASNFGTGVGGSVEVNAQLIALNEQSEISATTNSPDSGGNIVLNGSFLILASDSNITTNSVGDGGNIVLNIQDAIFGTPSLDSNILAQGGANGGRIEFPNELFLRGIAPRDDDFATSNDITPAGGFSEGTVSFRSGTQDSNPVQEQVVLPTNLIDPSQLIAQGCAAGNLTAAQAIGELVLTGRGGVPPTPSAQVDGAVNLPNLVESPSSDMPGEVDGEASLQTPSNPVVARQTPVVEAQGWMYGADGEVVLTASVAGASPQGLASVFPGCRDVF